MSSRCAQVHIELDKREIGIGLYIFPTVKDVSDVSVLNEKTILPHYCVCADQILSFFSTGKLILAAI